jgi:hypothetical protein
MMTGNSKAILDLIAQDDDDFDVEKVTSSWPTDPDEERQLQNVIMVRNARQLSSLCQSIGQLQHSHNRLYWLTSLALGCSVLAMMVSLQVDIVPATAGGIAAGVFGMLFKIMEG